MRRLRDLTAEIGEVEAYRAWVEGRLHIRDPDPPRSWYEALLRPDYSLWLYTLTALTIASLALTTIEGIPRMLGAGLLVFFLPGYGLVRLLYPQDSLKPLEELGLSIALSISIVAIVGLALNYSPLGIRPLPALAALTTITILTGLAGHHRSYKHLETPNHTNTRRLTG